MRLAAVLVLLAMVILTASCGGGGISTLTLAPTSMSLGLDDQAQAITPTAADNSGNVLTTPAITYTSTNTTFADVSTSTGIVCPGKWDNEASPVNCTPVSSSLCNASTPCNATITATVTNGPTATMGVAVHLPVDRVVITQISPASPGCVSVGSSVLFAATACSGTSTPPAGSNCPIGTDITSTVWSASVSPFVWTVAQTAATVAQVDPSGATCKSGNTCAIVGVTAASAATVTATLANAPGSTTTHNITSAPIAFCTQ